MTSESLKYKHDISSNVKNVEKIIFPCRYVKLFANQKETFSAQFQQPSLE